MFLVYFYRFLFFIVFNFIFMCFNSQIKNLAMEDTSGSSSPSSSESIEIADNAIPKINVKFDGSTWKNIHSSSGSQTECAGGSQTVEGSGLLHFCFCSGYFVRIC